jgi:DinB superfamily
MNWNKALLNEHLQTAMHDCLTAATSISDAVFFDNSNGKWSIAENLIHLGVSAKRLAGAMSLPKEDLIAKFGTASKPSRDYEEIPTIYYATANQRAIVAPPAFAATQTAETTRASVVEGYSKSHAFLTVALSNFTDEELEKHQIPHPLLGPLTVREMIYFTIFHIGHHQKAVDRIVAAHV